MRIGSAYQSLHRRILADDRRKRMKKLILSLATAAFVATPVLAAPTAKPMTRSAKAAAAAKEEAKESPATEAKEKKAAAHHAKAHKKVRKAKKAKVAKTTAKKTSTPSKG
jgi:hypothetical protein